MTKRICLEINLEINFWIRN